MTTESLFRLLGGRSEQNPKEVLDIIVSTDGVTALNAARYLTSPAARENGVLDDLGESMGGLAARIHREEPELLPTYLDAAGALIKTGNEWPDEGAGIRACGEWLRDKVTIRQVTDMMESAESYMERMGRDDMVPHASKWSFGFRATNLWTRHFRPTAPDGSPETRQVFPEFPGDEGRELKEKGADLLLRALGAYAQLPTGDRTTRVWQSLRGPTWSRRVAEALTHATTELPDWQPRIEDVIRILKSKTVKQDVRETAYHDLLPRVESMDAVVEAREVEEAAADELEIDSGRRPPGRA